MAVGVTNIKILFNFLSSEESWERPKGGQTIRGLLMADNVPIRVGISGLISMFCQEDFKAD